MEFDPAIHVVIDDIIISSELAKTLGVTNAAITNWRNRYDDFPQPFKTDHKARGGLFRRSEVIDWYIHKFPERVAAVQALAQAIVSS